MTLNHSFSISRIFYRCPQSQAFERRSDRNGIYMKHLIRHIHDDMRIENVVHKVHCGKYNNLRLIYKQACYDVWAESTIQCMKLV